MRLRRLELIRFGRFTDATIELPTGKPDLHIVSGPNEAGKSTVRAALGDLLFGIPSRSAFNFVHQYGRMRIGAALQANGTKLEFRRRKGLRNTILRPDESRLPQGESALAPFLGGADREFFERMFSLDHERLRKGGQEILEGGSDDAGQKLFSAGSGIQDLQKRLESLDKDASQLWGARKSAKKAYYLALERLKQAQARKREHSVSATRWNKLRRTKGRCETEYKRLRSDIQDRESELSKISRIRRISRSVADLGRFDRELNGLGRVRAIPRDSARRLEDSEKHRNQARLRIQEIRRSLEGAERKRNSIQWDAKLLSHSAEVKQLHKNRITVDKERADLPRLREKLDRLKEKLESMAARMHWSGGDAAAIAERIPDRKHLRRARRLVGEWRDRAAGAEIARQGLQNAKEDLAEIRESLQARGDAKDVETLRALLAEVRQSRGTLGASIDAARVEVSEANAEVSKLFAGLSPRTERVEELMAITTPCRDHVQQFRERWVEMDRERRSCAAELATKRRNRAQLERARERILSDERPVRKEELDSARGERDSLWRTIRRFALGKDGPKSDASSGVGSQFDLSETISRFEGAMLRADRLGDKRFETATAVARLAEADRALSDAREEVSRTKEKIGDLRAAGDALQEAWDAHWSGAPFQPGDPLQMLDWIGHYGNLQAAVLRLEKSRAKLVQLREHEAETIQRLVSEMTGIGTDPSQLEKRSLGEILELAERCLRVHDRDADAIQRLRGDLLAANKSRAAKRKIAEASERASQEARYDWLECAQELGIDPSAKPTRALARTEEIDAMREVKQNMQALQEDRIDKIERDLRRFDAQVVDLASAVRVKTSPLGARETSLHIERLLETAREEKKKADQADREVRKLRQRVRELQAGERAAEARIEGLKKTAGVTTVQALREEIRRAEDHRRLSAARAQATEEIREGGDGQPLDVLKKECANVELDQLKPRERMLRDELARMRQAFQEVGIRHSDARKAFEAVGGGDAAAVAEGERQEALAEISEISERYVQSRAATCLLRWAIDRYRTKKQGPMLERAGKLFSRLTLGSFDHLEVDLDDKDRAFLVGCRESGERVPMDGMSDGSADQLYFALRVAALEDYLSHAQPMPFVADDLFVNFDDDRAAAGFRVLASLARRCQVIFFTHHDHLVEVARSAVRSPIDVVRIPA